MPSASASSAPASAHSSSNWYQSAPERASRDISMPSTSPTCPMVISVTSRWNPTRPAALDPDLPRSSSITSTREVCQPSATARSTSPYCSRVDSPWSSTCWRVDWRTYTTASRSRCRSPTLLPSRSHGNSAVMAAPLHRPGPRPWRPPSPRPAAVPPPPGWPAPPATQPPPGGWPPAARPGLLDRPLWGQDLPPSSTTTRPPRHAHGPAAGPRPRPAATAPHVRVSAFVLLGQCSCVHSAWQLEQGHKQVKNELGWADFQVRSARAIRRHLVLVCCAFSFCWHATHATPDAQPVDSPPGHPPPAAPAHPAAPTPARGAIGTTPSAVGTRRIVAAGAASSPRLADPMARAAALVAGVVALPATPGRAGPADVGRSGQTAVPLPATTHN